MLTQARIPDSAIEVAKADIVGVVGRYLDLKKEGAEHVACCPFHGERSPSFKVNDAKGIWHCFGCGEGGDAISFVMKHCGLPFHEAVQTIVGDVQGVPTDRKRVARAAPANEWAPLIPVPDDAPKPPVSAKIRFHDGKWCEVDAGGMWAYRDMEGRLLGYIQRFDVPAYTDQPAKKEIRPLLYCRNSAGERAWRMQHFPTPRPIFGLDKLAQYPDASVIVVEGEKTAVAAQKLFMGSGATPDKLVVVSWPGGANAATKVDWSPLYGRKVGLWPDWDLKTHVKDHPQAGNLLPFLEQPGTRAMLDVFGAIQAHCKAVRFFLPLQAGTPDGWDLADEPPADFDALGHLKSRFAMNAADVRTRFSLTPSLKPGEGVLPVWLVPPTSEEDLERAAFAANLIAMCDAGVAQRLDPRGVLLRPYADAAELQAALDEVKRFMPNAKAHAVIPEAMMPAVAGLHGCTKEVLPAGESWVDTLWAAVTQRTGLKEPAMPDPAELPLAQSPAAQEMQGDGERGIGEGAAQEQALSVGVGTASATAANVLEAELAEHAAGTTADVGSVEQSVGYAGHEVPAQASMPVTAGEIPPPATVLTSPEDEHSLIAELGIRPLGSHGGNLVFWRCDMKRVVVLQAARLGSHQTLQQLAPMQRWETWAKNFKPSMASDILINTSMALGAIDFGRVPASEASPNDVRRSFLLALASSGSCPPVVLAELLSLDPVWDGVLYFDEFARRPVCAKVPPCSGDAGPWNNAHDALLSAYLANRFGVPTTSKVAADVANLLAKQNPRHPLREYLNELEWDGVPRADTWLVEHAGAEDTVYTRAVSSKTLIGAVARAFVPGTKVDTALVLESGQGVKKSSLLKALSPREEWFCEDLAGGIGGKDALQGLNGKWIVELPEMAAVGKASVGDVKSFLSRTVDTYRAPYDIRPEDHPRTAIFVGSVNPDADGAWLTDTTGGRRFWPVTVTKKTDLGAFVAVRDQLWAEAVHRYMKGEQHWLTDEVEALAAQEQQVRLAENPWERHVAGYIAAHPTATKVYAGEIFEFAQSRKPCNRDTADLRRIGEALKAERWKKGRKNGAPWQSPAPL